MRDGVIPAPLFRLSGLKVLRPGVGAVLDGLDFDVMPGERVVVSGSNGAGKTTLLHVMVGLVRPQAGSVTAFGRTCVDERDFLAVRRRAGLLFQDPDDQLFCPTVLEDVAFGPLNLGLSPPRAMEAARAALAALGLEGFEQRITYRLSGGERRLVSIATVLAMDPEVLLLDEPTNALDRDAGLRLGDILERLPQAMVVVSHDHELTARLATRRLRLEGGRLDAVFA